MLSIYYFSESNYGSSMCDIGSKDEVNQMNACDHQDSQNSGSTVVLQGAHGHFEVVYEIRERVSLPHVLLT